MAASIYSPRMGSVYFGEFGSSKTFPATITGLANGSYTWSAWIYNDYQTWGCTLDTPSFLGSNTWQVNVTTSANLPPEVLSLAIQINTTLITAPNSFSCVYNPNASFIYAHLSDEHLMKQLSTTGWAKSQSLAYVFSSVLSLANPRFVIHTGDNVEAGAVGDTTWLNWYMQAKQAATVPCLWHPGSHERLSDWALANMGPPYWVRDTGSFRIIGNDGSNANSRTTALTSLTESYLPGSGISFRLLCQHYYGYGAGCIEQADINTYTPTTIADFLMIMGHIHSNPYVAKIPPNTHWAILAITGQNGKACIMPVDRNGDGWTLRQSILDTYKPYPNYACLGGADITLVNMTTGAPYLYSTWANNNNASQSSNTALITNSTTYTFEDGRLRFVMQPGYTYQVSNGTIIHQYQTPTATVVLVQVLIPAGGTVGVNCFSTEAWPRIRISCSTTLDQPWSFTLE